MAAPVRTLFNHPIGDELDWLSGLIDRARSNAGELSDSDIRFVDSMLLRVDRYGAGTFLSDPQRRWLKDIENRLDAAEREEDEDPVARPVDEVWE